MALCQKCGRLMVSAKYPSATGTGPAVMSASSRRRSGTPVYCWRRMAGEKVELSTSRSAMSSTSPAGSPSSAAMTAAQANVPAWNDALYPGPFSGARAASPFMLAHPLVAYAVRSLPGRPASALPRP